MTTSLNRRSFLRGGAAALAVTSAAGGLTGLMARAAEAKQPMSDGTPLRA